MRHQDHSLRSGGDVCDSSFSLPATSSWRYSLGHDCRRSGFFLNERISPDNLESYTQSLAEGDTCLQSALTVCVYCRTNSESWCFEPKLVISGNRAANVFLVSWISSCNLPRFVVMQLAIWTIGGVRGLQLPGRFNLTSSTSLKIVLQVYSPCGSLGESLPSLLSTLRIRLQAKLSRLSTRFLG